RTPCSRIEFASSWRAASSKIVRGWSGFGSVRSSAIDLTPTLRPECSEVSREMIDGESSRSSDRRRAATARKSGLAKVDHLPGELAIRASGFRRAGIRGDRPAGQRRLSELAGVPDDATEDVLVADHPKLIQHVPREVRPAVVERRQQAEDPEVAIELHPDHVDDLDKIVQALHRVVLRLDRNDDAVRRDE